jgi:hypothetical protein
VAWAQELAAQIDSDQDFERCAPAPFSTVCFRYKGTDEQNRALLESVNASGEVFLSQTTLHGRYVLHLAIGNMGTTREHVQRAWALIKEAAEFPVPKLKFLHPENTLNRVKLDQFRRVSTDLLKASLVPGQAGSLKVRQDGTVLDGHHRISVLAERGEDINQFPREIMEKDV